MDPWLGHLPDKPLPVQILRSQRDTQSRASKDREIFWQVARTGQDMNNKLSIFLDDDLPRFTPTFRTKEAMSTTSKITLSFQVP